MKIATWNVNGIRARQSQVLEWISSDQPDIICLQEIKAAREQVPEALSAKWQATGATGTANAHIPEWACMFARDICPDPPQI